MTPKWSPNWPPTWSPKRMQTWLYHQDFAKFSLNRHYSRKKPVSAEAIEKVALQVEEDKSSNVLASTSVRRVAEALDLPRSTVQKIMRNILRYYP
ncbi:hypothetical protein TNCV_2450551 [Trichonephila clavipes]|nr:hypothetical protein TNCV_2450551 [Trichonephila clavipes]